MKVLLILSLLALGSMVFAAEDWLQPIEKNGDTLTYQGYIQIEREKLYDVRAKEFNGNYFLYETKAGGKRIPLYADWYNITSRIVGLKVRVSGHLRHMKRGDQIQIHTLEILNEN